MYRIFNKIVLLIFIGILSSCTEEIAIEDNGFESILVVESTLTNNLENQTVKLSRTSQLNDTIFQVEQNAVVSVMEGSTVYNFTSIGNGDYLSDEKFAAKENLDYQLNITTQNGKKYTSSKVQLKPVPEIEDLYVESGFSNNTLGAQILVDVKGLNDSTNYLRYEFEETYKIVTPIVKVTKGEIRNYKTQLNGCATFDIVEVFKDSINDVCYNNRLSSGINLANTSGIGENRATRVPVHFVQATDPVLLARYSILVKQYSQSLEANSFYEILKDFGGSGSVLSQNQPGFVVGNINAINDNTEKVLGFFEASSISEKRIYFNHEDLEFDRPDYFEDCTPIKYDYNFCGGLAPDPPTGFRRDLLYTDAFRNNYQFISFDFPIFELVKPACADCSFIGTTEKPEFWID